MPRKKDIGDGGSVAQKRVHGALPDAVRATKKSSTPVVSDTTDAKGAADKNKATRSDQVGRASRAGFVSH